MVVPELRMVGSEGHELMQSDGSLHVDVLLDEFAECRDWLFV